jgi:hypothetical protein
MPICRYDQPLEEDCENTGSETSFMRHAVNVGIGLTAWAATLYFHTSIFKHPARDVRDLKEREEEEEEARKEAEVEAALSLAATKATDEKSES